MGNFCCELSCPLAALRQVRCLCQGRDMALVFPLPLSCWDRGSTGREKGHCCPCLVPGICTGARPGLGAVPMCSFSPLMPGSFHATLGGRGRVSSVLSALTIPQHWAVLGRDSRWPLGWLPWLCRASCAWLGLCSAECSLPAAPAGNKSHGKLPTREQKDTGEGWGLGTLSRWHPAW